MVQSPVESQSLRWYPKRLILSSVLSNICINELRDEVGCTLSKVAGGKKSWEQC